MKIQRWQKTTLPKSKEAPVAMLEACMTPPNQPGGRNPGGLPLPLEERARRLTEQTIARILNADRTTEVVNG